MLIQFKKLFIQPVIITSIIITVLSLAVEQMGLLESTEMKIFDQMTKMRSASAPDQRILVVGITEQDLQQLQSWPLSGETLTRLFNKLEQYQPRVIGLDLFRDLRVEPGHNQLLKHLQESDCIISVCKHSDSTNSSTPPPQGTEPEQVGFSDVIEDADSIIRRNLLLVKPESTSACTTPYSFGLQLALHYLGNSQLKFTSKGEIQLGNTVFKRLQSHSGGYRKIDVRGYQILLNYRSAHANFQQVSLTEVLSDRINSDLVKNRVVLIGTTAPSIKDAFNTPYSSGQQDNQKMPGVVLQAQMVSQILSSVLNRQPVFWFLPEWGEILWIWIWTLVGAGLAWWIRHPIYLGMAGIVTSGGLLGSNLIIFTLSGWLPLVSPALGLVGAIATIAVYRGFNSQQQQETIARQVQEQEKTISLLQALLKESSNTITTESTKINLFQPDTILTAI